MGKDGGKKEDGESSDGSPKANDSGTAAAFKESEELMEEGNKLFQKRDHEGAILKYEKAINLLPRNHIDISHLRSNMASCYMQMGLSEYPSAIRECNLALEVTPKYSKALIKRAKCYEALNRLDLAFRDVSTVLKAEVNNTTAMEIEERVRYALERKGLEVNDIVIEQPSDYVELSCPFSMPNLGKKKSRKKSKKSKNVVETTYTDETEEMTPEDETEVKTTGDEIEEKKVDREESEAEDKVVVEETISSMEEEPKQTVKLVFGEDIRLQ